MHLNTMIVGLLLAAGLWASPARADDPDVSISTRVQAQSLKFEQVGHPQVRVTASPGGATVNQTRRGTLPTPLRAGVEYRNIDVSWIVSTRVQDVGRRTGQAVGGKLR